MAAEINELTHCPVCFELYDESGDHVPRILPCHCTLCQKCIGKLIKDNALECPQDRQKHKVTKGVKSFSQNKYILAHLKKDKIIKYSGYDECQEHGLKIILYCKQKDCQKGICPMCMSEKHLTHEVVNILTEKKNELNTSVDLLKKDLSSYHDKILMVKQQIEKESEYLTREINNRKDELLKELDEKLADTSDSLVTLNDIKEKTNKSTNQDDIANKIEFVQQLGKVSEESKEPLRYRFYELTEKEKRVDPSVKLSEALEPFQINKYVKQVLYSCPTNSEKVDAMHVLSDGTILLCGYVMMVRREAYTSYTERRKSKLSQYDIRTGDVLYSKEHEREVRSICEVQLSGQSCVAIAYRYVSPRVIFDSSRKGSIDFHCNPRIHKLAHSLQKLDTKTDVDPTFLYELTPQTILYANYGQKRYFFCNAKPPEVNSDVNIVEVPYFPSDVCYTKLDGEEFTVVANGRRGLLRYDRSLQSQDWKINGIICGTEKEIDARGIATDGHNNLFVYDAANECIQMFDTEGLYVGTMIREGEGGLGSLCKIKWCRKASALIVAHCIDEKVHLTALKLNL